MGKSQLAWELQGSTWGLQMQLPACACCFLVNFSAGQAGEFWISGFWQLFFCGARCGYAELEPSLMAAEIFPKPAPLTPQHKGGDVNQKTGEF